MSSIFNFEKFAENLGEVCSCYCYQCQKKTSWHYGKLTEWAKLFSLRTIPFRKEFFIFCEPCGDDFELGDHDFKKIESIVKSLGSIDDTHIKSDLFKKIHQEQADNLSPMAVQTNSDS